MYGESSGNASKLVYLDGRTNDLKNLSHYVIKAQNKKIFNTIIILKAKKVNTIGVLVLVQSQKGNVIRPEGEALVNCRELYGMKSPVAEMYYGINH